jgi:hypothetical protein
MTKTIYISPANRLTYWMSASKKRAAVEALSDFDIHDNAHCEERRRAARDYFDREWRDLARYVDGKHFLPHKVAVVTPPLILCEWQCCVILVSLKSCGISRRTRQIKQRHKKYLEPPFRLWNHQNDFLFLVSDHCCALKG